jgi:hypothetical protein
MCVARLVSCPYGCRGKYLLSDNHFIKNNGCCIRKSFRENVEDYLLCTYCKKHQQPLLNVTSSLNYLFNLHYGDNSEKSILLLSLLNLRDSNCEFSLLPRDIKLVLLSIFFSITSDQRLIYQGTNPEFNGPHFIEGRMYEVYSNIMGHCCLSMLPCHVNGCQKLFSTEKELFIHMENECENYRFYCFTCFQLISRKEFESHTCNIRKFDYSLHFEDQIIDALVLKKKDFENVVSNNPEIRNKINSDSEIYAMTCVIKWRDMTIEERMEVRKQKGKEFLKTFNFSLNPKK